MRAHSTISRYLLASLMFALTGCETTPSTSQSVCSTQAAAVGWTPPTLLAGANAFSQMIEELSASSVIVIGEYHERFDHHLTELEILCRVHATNPNVALGVEFIQQPFQTAVDRYLEGGMDSSAFLDSIEYFDRWGFDYRLYAPLVQFAKDNGIPIRALNVPAELTRELRDSDLSGVSERYRGLLPDTLPTPSARYRERIEATYRQHSGSNPEGFEHFLAVQQVWDEGMAQAASEWWRTQADQTLVIVAGNGHVAFEQTIADRVRARGITAVTTISQEVSEYDTAAPIDAAYRLTGTVIELPAPGRLGVALKDGEAGVLIETVFEGSAAEAAGLAPNDRITRINDKTIRRFTEVKAALWDQPVGASVRLETLRANQVISYEVWLR